MRSAISFSVCRTDSACWSSSTRSGGKPSASSAPAWRRDARGRTMRKAKPKAPEKSMRDEYDFSGGVRGKYARRFAEGSNVVVLDPDVAQAFPTARAVNQALRELAELARRQLAPGEK